MVQFMVQCMRCRRSNNNCDNDNHNHGNEEADDDGFGEEGKYDIEVVAEFIVQCKRCKWSNKNDNNGNVNQNHEEVGRSIMWVLQLSSWCSAQVAEASTVQLTASPLEPSSVKDHLQMI